MKVRCIDVYARTTRPNGPTLLNYQQLRTRNSRHPLHLKALLEPLKHVLSLLLPQN